MAKLKTYNSTWTIASNKLTKFGFHYRWYLPKFIYGMAMEDLKFIERNNKLIYKKAGYEPPITPKTNQLKEKSK